MGWETYIALATVVVSFLSDIVEKRKATKALVETNKTLVQAVDKLVETVENHGRRLDALENK